MANDWPTGGIWVTSPFHQISYLDSLAYKRLEIAIEDQESDLCWMNHASKLPGFSCQFVFQVVSLGTLQERDGESGQSTEGPTISGVSWRKS